MSHFGQYQDYGHWIMVSCIKVGTNIRQEPAASLLRVG